MTKYKPKVAILFGWLGYGGIARVYTELAPLLSEHFDLDFIVFDGSKRDYHGFEDAIGHIHFVVPEGQFRWYHPAKLWCAVRTYSKITKAGKYDLVLSSGHFENILGAFFSKKLNYKLIISQHSDLLTEIRNMRSRFTFLLRILIAKLCFYKADMILFVSKGVKKNIAEQFCILPDKCIVINNPVNILKIQERAKEQLDIKEFQWFSEGGIHFISAGRLTKAKNFLILLKAFDRLLKKIPDARLTILGQGEDRPILEKKINDLNITKNVWLPGFKNNIFKYFSKADCFVSSSDWEGFGYVAVEAMSCGKPVIGTSCSGTLDVLKDHNDRYFGIIISIGDLNALEKEMVSMVEKPEKRIKYSQLALERSKYFDIKLISERYVNMINQILKDIS